MVYRELCKAAEQYVKEKTLFIYNKQQFIWFAWVRHTWLADQLKNPEMLNASNYSV